MNYTATTTFKNENISPAEEYNRRLQIDDKHFLEWKESAVSEEIIFKNVASLHDIRVVNKLLNRRAKRKWNDQEDLVPCWYAAGVDPLTEEPTYQGLQLKPDNPRMGANGKPIKYESVYGMEGAPLFLDPCREEYWTNIINSRNPVIITEGAKKAGAGLSNGYSTISLPGVSSCRKLDRLHNNLELFCTPGRVFYLCFDNDVMTKSQVRKALIRLAGLLLTFPIGNVKIIILPPGELKGMDDFIAKKGKGAFDDLVHDAPTFKEWLEIIKDDDLEEKEEVKLCNLARRFWLIKDHWGDNLRYNLLKKRVELFGDELDEDVVRLKIALEYNEDIPIADAQTITKNISMGDSYSPVVEYLEECEIKFPSPDVTIFDNLAAELFGTNDPDHSTFFKNFCVAAVARAMNPGCWVDSVFVLFSNEQGRFKSKFLSVLFGAKFCSDQLKGDITSKDNLMLLSSYWCHELSELDKFRRQNTDGDIKTLITSPTDTFRAPYDRREKEHPRSCVFAATTNRQESLQDPTGSRRFNICPVTKKIPIDKVAKERDYIWASAVKLFRDGYKYHLSDEMEIKNEEKNKSYTVSSIWDELITNLIESRGNPDFLATRWVHECLGIETNQARGSVNAEVNATMTRLGWIKAQPRRVEKKVTRGWIKLPLNPNESENISSENKTVTNQVFVTPLADKGSSCYTTVTKQSENPSCNEKPTENQLIIGIDRQADYSGETVTIVGFDGKTRKITIQFASGRKQVVNQGVLKAVGVTKEIVTEKTADCNKALQPEPLINKGVTETLSVTTDSGENKSLLVKDKTANNLSANYINPEVNAQLLRLCIEEKNWGMVAELEESWDPGYKMDVWACLSLSERQALRNLENPQDLKEVEETYIPEAIPLLKEKEWYWCKTKKSRVRIFIASATGPLVNVFLESNKSFFYVQATDLFCCESSPRSNLKIGDKVNILSSGKPAIISSIDGPRIYLKSQKGGRTIKGEFFPHQISKN
jgi:predicted P-loop ATPase